MINKYKNISIIYGASGKECAIKMEKELQRLHINEFYPIKPFILANAILSSSSILDTVKNIISSSSACIVILTFDDVDHTRVRQNVLVEIGMALTLIDKENCFFISEKQKLPEDFPSDLQNVINPNYFDKNDLDTVVHNTCQEIIRHLNLKSYQNILQDNNYIYDYKKVLDDIPVKIFEEKADIQLEHILGEWENNIASFEFMPEKIMYLVERLKFFPDFNRSERFFEFLNNIEELIRPTEKDFEIYNRNFIINTCTFLSDIIHYTRIKLNREVLKHIANPSLYREELKQHKIEFKDIADSLKDFIENFEDGTFEYNWIMKIMAYEYTALAYMKYIACLDCYDEKILSLMKFIISCYENVIKIGKQNDMYSKILWMGYAQYDLTRAYENMYKITKDKSYLEKVEEYSQASIVTRYKWFYDNPFKGVFSNALSYEYFLVYKYEYELRYKYQHYTDDGSEEILKGLDKLKTELNHYYESTGLGRLYDMRDDIDILMEKVKN